MTPLLTTLSGRALGTNSYIRSLARPGRIGTPGINSVAPYDFDCTSSRRIPCREWSCVNSKATPGTDCDDSLCILKKHHATELFLGMSEPGLSLASMRLCWDRPVLAVIDLRILGSMRLEPTWRRGEVRQGVRSETNDAGSDWGGVWCPPSATHVAIQRMSPGHGVAADDMRVQHKAAATPRCICRRHGR